MKNKTISSKNIIAKLENTSNTTISSDIVEAIEVITSVICITPSDKAWFKGKITTVKIISLNSSLKKIISKSHKNVALKAIEFLKLEDILELDDEVKLLKIA